MFHNYLTINILFDNKTNQFLQVQITRLKENNERIQSEIETMKTKEHSAQEKAKTSMRQVRELREENIMLTSKEHEAQVKIKELDKNVETAEADAVAARSDLRLALQRIEDLQCAIQGDMEDADDHSGSSDRSVFFTEQQETIFPTFIKTKVRIYLNPPSIVYVTRKLCTAFNYILRNLIYSCSLWHTQVVLLLAGISSNYEPLK